MRRQKLTSAWRVWRLGAILSLLLCAAVIGRVNAEASTSAHYMVNEAQFGSGSSLHDCSASYCAKTSAGDTTVGSTSSTSYTAQTGFNTTDVPLLEVMTSGGTQDLGVLDIGRTGTATASVKVRSYLSAGYTIQLTGSPPSQGQHSLSTLATPTSSHPGAEQFGVNLVANTTPAIGANPVQVPSSSFSSGAAESDYSNPNLFKYVDGDIVARSLTSSGETDFTLSMILNVSNVTPGGRYYGSFSAVVVPLY